MLTRPIFHQMALMCDKNVPERALIFKKLFLTVKTNVLAENVYKDMKEKWIERPIKVFFRRYASGPHFARGPLKKRLNNDASFFYFRYEVRKHILSKVSLKLDASFS